MGVCKCCVCSWAVCFHVSEACLFTSNLLMSSLIFQTWLSGHRLKPERHTAESAVDSFPQFKAFKLECWQRGFAPFRVFGLLKIKKIRLLSYSRKEQEWISGIRRHGRPCCDTFSIWRWSCHQSIGRRFRAAESGHSRASGLFLGLWNGPRKTKEKQTLIICFN